MENVNTYRTEDGVTLSEGDDAYDYYSMKPGKIGKGSGMSAHVADGGAWFTFEHDDGGSALLNGQRICSCEYAIRRNFKDARPARRDA